MNKKIIALLLTLLLAAGVFAGCAPKADAPAADTGSAAATEQAPPAEEPANAGITVTDMTGREVTLEAPAQQVVALTAADVEILYAVGAGDTLVGRGEYCNYPPEALDVTAVQSGSETNTEQVIALAPDLLIMDTMAQSEEQITQFEDAGIPVFVTDANSIDETYTSIELIGVLLGKEAEAAKVVDDMKQTFADLSAKAAAAAGGEEQTIYFEVSPLEFGLWASGADTFMNEVADLLKLKNIFGDVSGWVEVSEEQVIERNPDYILTVGMYFGDGPTPIESILSRLGWADITAVKNKAILNLTGDELSRPGPRLAEGAKLLYEFVYEGGAAEPNAQ
ncbi:MAG: ABC transporter substrate-binding protein [Clostridiales Family XIII bacterium]|jgi:iron complex transport system substrate-binding protein|nr:ABC transporter substrate-binding protein [Clostridiales Family XIII bacterium]